MAVLAYAQRRPREQVRYASLPAWVFQLNALSILVGLGFLILSLSVDDIASFLLGIADYGLILAQFLLVALPSFGKVLFVERVSLGERLTALGMVVVAVIAIASPLLVGMINWDFCC